MGTFQLGGQTYRTDKLSAFDQFNIARWLAQALIPLSNLRALSEAKPDQAALARAFVTLSATIPNDEMNQAIGKLLGCVSRAIAGDAGWSKIATPPAPGQPPALMYADIALDDLNRILIQVMDEHGLIDFFVDRPSVSPAPLATTASTG